MTINQLFELVFLMSKKFYVNVAHFNISDIILSETTLPYFDIYPTSYPFGSGYRLFATCAESC